MSSHLLSPSDAESTSRRTFLREAAYLTMIAGGIGLSKFANAQSRTVTVIVGYGAGSTFDQIGRAVLDDVGARLGRPMVLENRTGAAGQVANAYVAKAKPDGDTLMLGGAGSHAVTPAVKASLPYDPERDFTAIAGIATFPCVFVVPRTLPVNNVQEFIQYAKQNPGKVSFGSGGLGTTPHLAMEQFKILTGVDIQSVPYRDIGPMKLDLQAGRLQVAFDTIPSIIGLIEQGSLRAIAVTSKDRNRRLPNVPTMAEAGIQNFVVESWVGAYGPAGMDPALTQTLSSAFVGASLSEDGRKRLMALGAEPTGYSSQQFDAIWRADIARWKDVVKRAGLKLEA